MAYYLDLSHQAQTNAYFEWDSEPEHMRMFGLSSSQELAPENLPDRATRRSGKQTPDVFAMPGLNAVNERFRELVEDFEPDTHLFHPIVLREKDGSRIAGRHYIFSARVHFDCVLLQKSKIGWVQPEAVSAPFPEFRYGTWETHHPRHPKSRARLEARHGIAAFAAKQGINVDLPRKLWVSAPAIEGHHLWTGVHICTSGLWVSDAFFKAFEKAKIRSLISHAYGFESEEPWLRERELAPRLDWERVSSQL